MQKQTLFVTLFAILTTNILTAKVIPCGQQAILELDENVRALSVLGDPNGKYPLNEEEVDLHCQEDRRMVWWGGNYSTRCLKGRDYEMSRTVTKLLMSSMNSVANKRCKGAARKRFIDAGKCGNSVQSDTIKCFSKYILESEQINRSKKTLITNQKHLLPLICCAYHRFFDCTSDIYDKSRKTCTDNDQKELEGYTRESLYSVIQYLCGDYEGSNDKCDRLRISYKHIFDVRVGTKSLPRSPLGPSNEVFDSLPPPEKSKQYSANMELDQANLKNHQDH